MAIAFNKSNVKSKLGWSNSFDTDGAFPLDLRAWFGSYDDAVAAAATAVDFGSTASKYHYGQQLYVFDGATATTYLIQGDNSLKEIGKNTDPMKFVASESEMLALTDITVGQQVYREDTHTIWLYKGTDPSSLDNWTESAAQNDTKWQGTDSKVNFYSLARSTYDGLDSKDTNTLYFITDEHRILKGNLDMTTAVQSISTLPELSVAIPGKFYLNPDSLSLAVTFDNKNWLVATPGYLTDGGNWATADSNKLATIGLIKKGIQSTIDALSFDASFDNSTGTISVGNGAGAVLTGVSHNPTYDSTKLKLTIPVYGGDDIVVDIPKDKFVTAGSYNTETKNIELTIENQEEKVLIPASALVDIYVADNTDKNIQVTVTDDNKISASLTIDPTITNALKYTPEKGFMVDVSDKIGKLTKAAGGKLVLSKADGSIEESTIEINASSELGNSTTEVPVASVIATAISTAVNAAADNKIDKISGVVDNVVVFSTDGAIKDSGKKIGGSTLSSTPDADTLATEAAVADVSSWKTLGE